MTRRSESPVVVAVDETGCADEAVEWAAAEAATRRRPLRMIHVLGVAQSVDPCATGAVIAQLLTERARAEDLLARARRRAAHVASELAVSSAVLDGPVTWALRREAHSASLLVLGARDRRTRWGRVLADSVSGSVTRDAACPVVVVRRRAEAGAPPGRAPTVVVGLELGIAGSAAVRFAFAAAEQRGIGVTAVDARDVAELTEASRGAALLVLPGVGRRSLFRSTPSVGRALLTQSGCPLAVVRTDATVRGSQPYPRMVPWTASSGSD